MKPFRKFLADKKLAEGSMGVARMRGNKDTLDDVRLSMRRLVKIFDQVVGGFEMSHIDSKAKKQAQIIARLDKAVSDFDDALYDLKNSK